MKKKLHQHFSNQIASKQDLQAKIFMTHRVSIYKLNTTNKHFPHVSTPHQRGAYILFSTELNASLPAVCSVLGFLNTHFAQLLPLPE